MIYISKTTKKTKREEILKLSVSKAKEYLFGLSYQDFLSCDFYILGSDSEDETKDVLSYFNKKYFILDNSSAFDIYKINSEIKKPQRLKHKGVSLGALQKFKEKIIIKIPHSIVSFNYQKKFFEIFVGYEGQTMRFVCNYNLEILESYIDSQKDPSNLAISNKIKKIINSIFRRQRYYYKNKRRKGK